MKINFSYLNYLRPNAFIKSISDINIFMLKRSGIKYIFCDLDNTLVPHFTQLPNNTCVEFIKNIRKNGIKVFIVSNNSKKRVETFCDYLDIDDFIYKANKPFVYKIKKILKKYNIAREDVLVIGDQFITDVWMSNRLGFKSILVLPLVDSVESNFQNLLISFLEKLVYKNIPHSNLFDDNDNSEMLKENYDFI